MFFSITIRFSQKLMDKVDCLDLCKEIVKFFIEEQLKWSDEDIENNISVKTFYNNGFVAMLRIVFNGSPYKAIENAYPNKLKN